MSIEIDNLDQHVVVVCSPFIKGASSADIASWEYQPGDARNDVVVIPERYLGTIATNVADATRDLGVYWNTYEEDWVEKPSDLRKFYEAFLSATSNDGIWPTIAHREIAFAILALAKRALDRSTPIIIVS